jgi:hypothetical protein
MEFIRTLGCVSVVAMDMSPARSATAHARPVPRQIFWGPDADVCAAPILTNYLQRFKADPRHSPRSSRQPR